MTKKKRASRQVFTDAENDRLRAAVAQLVEQYGTQQDVAKKLDVTQPTVSAFMLGRNGASIGFARAVARLLGKSLYEILSWKTEDVRDAGPMYPTRDLVVEHVRAMGFGDDVLGQLATHAPSLDRGEPDALYYLRMACMLEEQARVTRR